MKTGEGPDIVDWIESAASSLVVSAAGDCPNAASLPCAMFDCAWIGKCMKTFDEAETQRMEETYKSMEEEGVFGG